MRKPATLLKVARWLRGPLAAIRRIRTTILKKGARKKTSKFNTSVRFWNSNIFSRRKNAIISIDDGWSLIKMMPFIQSISNMPILDRGFCRGYFIPFFIIPQYQFCIEEMTYEDCMKYLYLVWFYTAQQREEVKKRTAHAIDCKNPLCKFAHLRNYAHIRCAACII